MKEGMWRFDPHVRNHEVVIELAVWVEKESNVRHCIGEGSSFKDFSEAFNRALAKGFKTAWSLWKH